MEKDSCILYLAKQSHIQNHYQVSSDPPIAVCYIRSFINLLQVYGSIDGELATFVLAKMRQPEQYVCVYQICFV